MSLFVVLTHHVDTPVLAKTDKADDKAEMSSIHKIPPDPSGIKLARKFQRAICAELAAQRALKKLRARRGSPH